MSNNRRVDPFRPLLISSVEQTSHQDWANRLKSEHYVEKGQVEGPRGGITPQMLTQKKSQLRKVNEVRTPFAENLMIKRDGDHAVHASGADFTDFAVKTRQHLRQIAETKSGQQLFTALDQDITGKRINHKVHIQDAGKQIGLREGSRTLNAQQSVSTELDLGGVKLDWPGQGAGSVVSHHTDITQRWGNKNLFSAQDKSAKEHEGGLGMSGALALGHELIHSAHGAQGFRATGLTPGGVKKEEANTVGPADGSSPFTNMPTENALRREMTNNVFKGGGIVKSMGVRTTYGGKPL